MKYDISMCTQFNLFQGIVMGLWAKFGIHRVGLQAGNNWAGAGASDCTHNFFRENSLLLFGLSTSWMRPTHII